MVRCLLATCTRYKYASVLLKTPSCRFQANRQKPLETGPGRRYHSIKENFPPSRHLHPPL